MVSGATQSASKIGARSINISTPVPQHTRIFSSEQISAMILPKRQSKLINILQGHHGPQQATAGGPDAVTGAETLHAKIAGEALEISAWRSKEQAVAGREYRSISREEKIQPVRAEMRAWTPDNR